MADIGEDFENIVNAGYLVLIFAGLGLAAYIIYEVVELGESTSSAISNFLCSLSIGSGCGNAVDTGNLQTGNLNISSPATQTAIDNTQYDKQGGPTGLESCIGSQCTPYTVDSSGNVVYQ